MEDSDSETKMEIAVIGRQDFCLGFRLAGIQKIFETDSPRESIKSLKDQPEVGVVVFDQTLNEKLEPEELQDLEDSLKPIYLWLSAEASEDSLKKMVRKSIGVEI